jgi:hypothetical protein
VVYFSILENYINLWNIPGYMINNSSVLNIIKSLVVMLSVRAVPQQMCLSIAPTLYRSFLILFHFLPYFLCWRFPTLRWKILLVHASSRMAELSTYFYIFVLGWFKSLPLKSRMIPPFPILKGIMSILGFIIKTSGLSNCVLWCLRLVKLNPILIGLW